MPTEPTDEDVAFAKRWASMQEPPVELNYYARYGSWSFRYEKPADFVMDYVGSLFSSQETAWKDLASVLVNYRRSLAPVIIAEERERIAAKLDSLEYPERSDEYNKIFNFVVAQIKSELSGAK